MSLFSEPTEFEKAIAYLRLANEGRAEPNTEGCLATFICQMVQDDSSLGEDIWDDVETLLRLYRAVCRREWEKERAEEEEERIRRAA